MLCDILKPLFSVIDIPVAKSSSLKRWKIECFDGRNLEKAKIKDDYLSKSYKQRLLRFSEVCYCVNHFILDKVDNFAPEL